MTDDEVKSKQEETLNNLKKYNKERNTEIADDPEEILNELSEDLAKDDHFEEAMQKLTEINEELGLYDEPEKPFVHHICEFCGDIVYPGQVHGLGFCKEKIQYEQ